MNTRKLISLLTAAILLVGLVPMTAYAAGTPIVEVTDIVEVTSQGQGQNTVYTFPFDGVVVIKQGGNLWVWTLGDLSDDVEEAMKTTWML